MTGTQKVCIIGGGATGAAMLWCLAQYSQPGQSWDITLIHNQTQLGGHSLTLPIQHNGNTYNVDLGVQFIGPVLYPNVYVMLARPEFQGRAPLVSFDQLKVACAFQRDANDNPQNWGNFPEYQQGANFALFSSEMQADAETFQKFIEVSLIEGWASKTVAEYFAAPPQAYQNQQQFVDFFVWPYFSIINGYGLPLLDQMTFADVFPLFGKLPDLATPLGSFTQPGLGWQRFANGASSWVQAMVDVAQSYTKPSILLSSTATAVWTDQNDNNVVHVQWKDASGNPFEETFDKVVLTTDMHTNAALLNNPNNQHYWTNLYQNYITPDQWALMPGMCYVHTDASMLSPDLPDQLETLQYNAYYAPHTNTYPFFDPGKTFTTFIQKNLLNEAGADGLYLTMYGYSPEPGDKVPDQDKVIYSQSWTHGMWAASFMGGPKKQLHLAQGLGAISYPGQADTNVYFAGNNTTTDAEEGALDSAMIIANYAFGVPYPLTGAHLLALLMYYIFYHEVMFPGQDTSSRLATLRQLIAA